LIIAKGSTDSSYLPFINILMEIILIMAKGSTDSSYLPLSIY